MIALIVLIILMAIISLLQYTNHGILAQNQYQFLIFSTFSAFLILIVFKNILTENNNNSRSLMINLNDLYMMPLLFYFIWYIFSSISSNYLAGEHGDYIGYDDQSSRWVSIQDRLDL